MPCSRSNPAGSSKYEECTYLLSGLMTAIMYVSCMHVSSVNDEILTLRDALLLRRHKMSAVEFRIVTCFRSLPQHMRGKIRWRRRQRISRFHKSMLRQWCRYVCWCELFRRIAAFLFMCQQLERKSHSTIAWIKCLQHRERRALPHWH